MTGATPTFEAAPLVEAVFDLFAEPSQDHSSELERRFFAEVEGFAGDVEEWHAISGQVQLRQGRLSGHSVQASQQGVRHWNPSRSRAVLFGPTVLGFNVMNVDGDRYGHFTDHAARLEHLVNRFFDVARPTRLLGAGHRYINQVTIALEERCTGRDLFTLYPALSDAQARQHPGVAVQVELGRFASSVVTGSLALTAKTPTSAVYVLDVAARTEGVVPATAQALTAWHTEAHRQVVAAFLASITSVGRARFQEKT
jgi:uncharacterized protein (TIGR04255 family)